MLIVSITSQEMALLVDGKISRLFKISTSKNPPSCIAESFGTPTGLHQLADFIGADQPLGMVFKGRLPTGRHHTDYSRDKQVENLITSRVIRLRGLELNKNTGLNCDTYDRYVYIHGTNHEARIGSPFSGGCLEMLNSEVVELFDLVEPGDLLMISEN